MEKMSSVLTDDQHFLLYFIMGTYFAPDLKHERPRKSALQRRAEGLPMYSTDELAGTQIKIVVMASVYYYVLRNAEQSLVVKLPSLLQFVRGKIATPVQGCAGNHPQFGALFPPKLHAISLSESDFDVIENIAFVNNPETCHHKLEDIERFRKLSGLKNFQLDRDSAILHILADNKALSNIMEREESKVGVESQHVNIAQPISYLTYSDTPAVDDVLAKTGVLDVSLSYSLETPSAADNMFREDLENGVMFLPHSPSNEEWSNLVANIKGGLAVTGSVARAQVGPALGLVDIGESEDSYLFRVSLPGVKRDEREFSCEVESDGSVFIKGVTVTGEIAVDKYLQVFEMQSQNLCPSGPFSISFKLPGPVDPLRFHGTFGTDGILEGIVLKERRCHV